MEETDSWRCNSKTEMIALFKDRKTAKFVESLGIILSVFAPIQTI